MPITNLKIKKPIIIAIYALKNELPNNNAPNNIIGNITPYTENKYKYILKL